MVGNTGYNRENGTLVGEVTADLGNAWQIRNRFEQFVEVDKDLIVFEANAATSLNEKYKSNLQTQAKQRAVVASGKSAKAKILNLAAILCLLFFPLGSIPIFFLVRGEKAAGVKLAGHLLSAYVFAIWGMVHVLLGLLLIIRVLILYQT